MKILIFIIILNLFSGLALAQKPIEEKYIASTPKPAKDVHWDEAKGILTYTIPEDCRIKLRAGSADGPVYRTLVNLEQRKPGKYEEYWPGKDESGRIDFKDFGPLYFCVDTMPKPRKDILLLTTVTKISEKGASPKIRPKKGITSIGEKPLSITVNIDRKDKEWFLKDSVEVMLFLDNRLIRLERADKLPHALKLQPEDLTSGEHLLSLNVWSSDHASVASKNLLIFSEAREEAKPREAAGKPQKEAARPNPSSGKIVYCQRSKGYWQVFTSDLDGSTPKQLTKSPVDKRYPCFSPSGKKIAFVTNNGQLWVVDYDGQNKRQIPLPVHASQPCWHPDGKKLAFISYQDLYHGDTELWEVELEASKLKKIISRPWMQYDPCYSPDGEKLLFTDGPELYAQDIRKLDFKTKDVTQLTDNGPYDYDMQPGYSFDGGAVIYSSNQDGNYDIWIMDKFGRNPRNLTKNPAYDMMPQITKDAKRIFFLSDRSGSIEVWAMNIEGKQLQQLTDNKRDKQDLTLYSQISE